MAKKTDKKNDVVDVENGGSEATKTKSKEKYNNEERRWSVPSKRAASFASERKDNVHKHGDKEGQELTKYEAGLRSGYLMCQSDHAGIYIFKKAMGEGKTYKEAKRLSRIRGKKQPKEAA